MTPVSCTRGITSWARKIRALTPISPRVAVAQPILKKLRRIIHAACPGVEETMKWSCPFFEYHGILCGTPAFKAHWRVPVVS